MWLDPQRESLSIVKFGQCRFAPRRGRVSVAVSVAVLVAGEAGAHAHLNTCGECPDSPGKVAL